MVTVNGFYEESVDPLQLIERLQEFNERWVYRGQPSRFPLQTTLERACENASTFMQEAPGIENEMLRHFRRLYEGNDKTDVRNDTLYCLSLMQHFGAPTRLLDFTYSPFIAAYFALEYAYDHSEDPEGCAVWCLNQDWCSTGAKKAAGKILVETRNYKRDEESFQQLYYAKTPLKLVFMENPLILHTRLHLQQGLFLCPGDIRSPFTENMKCFFNYNMRENVVKLNCKTSTPFERTRLIDALERLQKMNITRASLFPGLDGFAKTMHYRLTFYQKLTRWRKIR